MRLREIAFSISHAEARGAVHALIEEFATVVAPVMPALRRQVVHNDATRMNVLVDPDNHDRIAGFIDFGDIAETPVVFDVAIAALSQPAADMSAADAVAHFVRGFHAVRPLTRRRRPNCCRCWWRAGLRWASRSFRGIGICSRTIRITRGRARRLPMRWH